jgi:hypothetical protein
MALGTWIEKTTESIQLANTTYIDTFSYVLRPDEIFYYRIYPKNGVGYGAYSDVFSFLSDTFPKYMFPPVST